MFVTENSSSNPPTPARRSARVLVVDGDGVLRAELTTALAGAGHDVESAASGQAAVAVARASAPDVVLFDLHLPDMSGLELCARLQCSCSASARSRDGAPRTCRRESSSASAA